MKRLNILAAAAALSACGTLPEAAPQQAMVGMANPASEFCVRQGGTLLPQKDAEGNEYALCRLPDGQVVEEWAYFRAHAR
ncbi:putative hemolysin [Bergeriella denitrificans]|uniref:Hemolysin n=1 Tax=Bergeriella denitrificans TaxID=494 RepID=A0A378UE71_BERDE|nr:DUF333 domain-containing protein [Bergeriella denitrificans]STZ75605.1 Putative hemolysin [Bergeriella denitrificans]